MAYKMISLDGCSVQSSTTGRTQCKCSSALATQHAHDTLHSIRAKIRDGLDGYTTSDDYWIRCLYEDEKGDPGDVEKGFLKSALLVKVGVSGIALTTR